MSSFHNPLDDFPLIDEPAPLSGILKLEASVRRTPLLDLDSVAYGSGIYGKAENLQTRGSYKIRGVVNVLRKRTTASLRNGVSTISAGNLGQSLAYAAAELGIPCRVYVPESAPKVKKEAILKFGAELIELPFKKIWEMVLVPPTAEMPGLVHPCFDPDLRGGYEGIATEILDDLPSADSVVIPYGLGGLTLGIATVLKLRKPGIQIFAAEIESAAPVTRARRGEVGPPVAEKSKLVDAIGTPHVIPDIYARVSPLLAGTVVVSEIEAARAMRELYRTHGLVVEGAAAVAFAAAAIMRKKSSREKIVVVLSGRNIDPEKVFAHLP
jgi:threonine dehydratase